MVEEKEFLLLKARVIQLENEVKSLVRYLKTIDENEFNLRYTNGSVDVHTHCPIDHSKDSDRNW